MVGRAEGLPGGAPLDPQVRDGVAEQLAPPPFDWKHPDYLPIIQERDARLKAIRQDSDLLAAALVHYKEHPVGLIDFVEDWMFTFDPRLEGLKMVPFVLWEKQREYLLWLKTRYDRREDAVVEKSRDQGATWLNMAFAIWLWRFYADVKIGFGSRKEQLVDRLDDPDSIFEMGQ